MAGDIASVEVDFLNTDGGSVWGYFTSLSAYTDATFFVPENDITAWNIPAGWSADTFGGHDAYAYHFAGNESVTVTMTVTGGMLDSARPANIGDTISDGDGLIVATAI